MKERLSRINEEMKRELSEIIRELKDPRINAMTSIVAVETAKDLKHAKVYVSVFGNEEQKKKTVEGLTASVGFVRRELGERVKLRHLPEIRFVEDHSIEQGAHINELLRKLDVH